MSNHNLWEHVQAGPGSKATMFRQPNIQAVNLMPERRSAGPACEIHR